MSVRDHDERWDELALGHVLGGLPTAEASSFRTHLVSCSQCRTRVAELRSLDSDMAAAAREERATQRDREARRTPTRTDSTWSDADTEPATRPEDQRPRWRTVIALAVAALLLGGLSLWNAHLRTQNAYVTDLAEAQDETLGVIGRGTVVPVTTSGDVTGVVSVDGDRVAFALSNVPTPGPAERLVVWVRDETGPRPVDVLPQVAVADGTLWSSIAVTDARALIITVESDPAPGAPSGEVVLRADLPGPPPAPAGADAPRS